VEKLGQEPLCVTAEFRRRLYKGTPAGSKSRRLLVALYVERRGRGDKLEELCDQFKEDVLGVALK
jgi:hypothetical protein